MASYALLCSTNEVRATAANEATTDLRGKSETLPIRLADWPNGAVTQHLLLPKGRSIEGRCRAIDNVLTVDEVYGQIRKEARFDILSWNGDPNFEARH